MSSSAIVTTATTTPATPNASNRAPREYKKRVPKKIAEAIRLMTTGEVTTLKAASERVKMNYTHLCESLKKPHVQVFAAQKARQNLTAGTLRASARVIELLDAGSEHVAADMSKYVLALDGIKPDEQGTQVSVNVSVSAGYVINLSDPRGQPAKVIENEPRPVPNAE